MLACYGRRGEVGAGAEAEGGAGVEVAQGAEGVGVEVAPEAAAND